jgi:hypothetical protein
MPAQDGGRGDDLREAGPAFVESAQQHPEQAVAGGDARAHDGAPEDAELLAEGDVFLDQTRARPDGRLGEH